VLIYMARHGAFAGAGDNAVADARLSPQGRDEARALGEALAGTGIVSLYSSPLPRALETARIVGEIIGLEPWPLGGLAEHTSPEPPEDADEPDSRILIQEEAHYAAAAELLGNLGRRHYLPTARIALVSHGNMISTLLSVALGLGPCGYVRFFHDTSGLSILEWNPGRTRVLCVNATNHLEERQSAEDLLPR
jgi:probable phosphoglycerate mutase